MVTFEQFKEMDIRVARVVAVEDHPDADRLYVLTVETGDRTKKIVAGIKPFYASNELLGKEIIVVDNLQPATIRGVKSEGMLLAARDSRRLAILVPEKELETGSRVS